MTRLIFTLAFVLGAAAVVTMGANFLHSNALALSVTGVIGGVYVIGAVELVQFRRATATLSRSLAGLDAEAAGRLVALDEWLIKLHASLQHPVRRRVEGERIGLPAPVLTPYLVSLLVMLGLLGTFVGLVETLKGVVVALEGSSELESIRQALTAPMSGLGLAFGTSVAGVAASAMLGLMSALSRRERMLTTRVLDAKLTTELRRFSLTHQRQETFNALQVQSRSLPEIADRLQALAEHMERMTDRLGERLVSNQSEFHAGAKVLYGELAASVERSLRDSVAKTDGVLAESARLVGEGIRPVVAETLATLSEQIGRSTQDTHRHLSRTVEDQMQSLAARFAQTSEQVAHAWRDGLAAHGRANAGLIQGLTLALDGFREAFEGTSDRLLASIEQTTADWREREAAADAARIERWNGVLEQTWRQAAERLESASGAIIGELGSATATQRASMQALSEDLGRVAAELTTRLRDSAEQAAARQQAVTATLDAAAGAAAENLQAGSARIVAEMSDLLSASEALVTARVETEQSWQAGHAARMDGLAATLREELAALRDDEARRGNAAAERLAALEATVATHLSTLGKALEAPMAHLIEVASETPRAAAEVIGQLRREISNNVERDNRLLEERGRLMAELDALSESLARSTSGQLAAIEKLAETSGERLQAIGEQFSRHVGAEVAKVSEVADHFAVSAAEIASLGEAFTAAVDLYNDANGRLIENLRRIESALEQSTARSDEQLGYYVAQAREVIDYSVLTQKEIFDELRQLQARAADAGDAAGVN